MKRFAAAIICILFCTGQCATVSASERVAHVVCDAGHGGVDGGAVAQDGTLEKDLNLQISLIAVDLFRLMGYNVTATRTDDRSIHDDGAQTIREKKVSDIHNRLAMINETDADFMISFHQNKFEQSKYRGTQVFYGGLNDASKPLAESVQKSVRQLIQPENNREVKKGGKSIYLLYHCKKPIILVECGFISNSDELHLLKQDDYQKKICFAVLCGTYANNTNGPES